MAMDLQQQINYFEVQQRSIVTQLMTEKNKSLKKKLDATALFFKDVIASLKELKVKRESSQNININIESLIKSVDIKDISTEDLTKKISECINAVINSNQT
jgi:hypothetical protein